MTMSGAARLDEGERSADPPALRRRRPVADLEQAGQALAHPVVGVDDQHTKGSVGLRLGVGIDPMVMAGPIGGKRTFAQCRLGRTTRTAYVNRRGWTPIRWAGRGDGRRRAGRRSIGTIAAADQSTSIVVPWPGR
jgi:hypothetical protein